jgi:polyisoprenoid-binding protein YceI
MTTFKLDKVHSGVAFQVKHMMVSKTKGEFTNFDVEFEGDLAILEEMKINVTVDVTSINTNNEDRDGHLRSADFFDVEKFPHITIQSQSIKKLSDEEYALTALVTIKDIKNTKNVQSRI